MAMTVHGADAGRAVLILCGGRSFFFNKLGIRNEAE